MEDIELIYIKYTKYRLKHKNIPLSTGTFPPSEDSDQMLKRYISQAKSVRLTEAEKITFQELDKHHIIPLHKKDFLLTYQKTLKKYQKKLGVFEEELRREIPHSQRELLIMGIKVKIDRRQWDPEKFSKEFKIHSDEVARLEREASCVPLFTPHDGYAPFASRCSRACYSIHNRT